MLLLQPLLQPLLLPLPLLLLPYSKVWCAVHASNSLVTEQRAQVAITTPSRANYALFGMAIF